MNITGQNVLIEFAKLFFIRIIAEVFNISESWIKN